MLNFSMRGESKSTYIFIFNFFYTKICRSNESDSTGAALSLKQKMPPEKETMQQKISVFSVSKQCQKKYERALSY